MTTRDRGYVREGNDVSIEPSYFGLRDIVRARVLRGGRGLFNFFLSFFLTIESNSEKNNRTTAQYSKKRDGVSCDEHHKVVAMAVRLCASEGHRTWMIVLPDRHRGRLLLASQLSVISSSCNHLIMFASALCVLESADSFC